MADNELVATVDGREMYMDQPAGGLEAGGDLTTLTHRLRRDAVLRVLDRHAGIFVLQTEDPESGELVEEDQTEYIRGSLADAWTAYAAEASDETSAAGFRDYLATHEEHVEAQEYLDGLNALFVEMHTMGAKPREMRASVDTVLGPITPEAMDQETLEQAIGVQTIG